MSGNNKEHWETVYKTREIDTLGWYEETPTPSINLVAKLGLSRHDAILDVGSGASTLIDHLADQGYENIFACDISETALEKLKDRLGEEKASRITWIVDDITCPTKLKSIGEVALWHDRAMLHFLREEEERNAYLATLKSVVKKGGHVIIAVFSTVGAKKCSGLDLKNYDEKLLADFLGDDFTLVEHFSHIYHMPSGDARPYVYTLFRRKQC